MTTNNKEYCSPATAAAEIGVARQTIYVYLKAGKLRGRMVRGTRWQVLLEDVEEMKAGNIDVSGLWKDWRKETDA